MCHRIGCGLDFKACRVISYPLFSVSTRSSFLMGRYRRATRNRQNFPTDEVSARFICPQSTRQCMWKRVCRLGITRQLGAPKKPLVSSRPVLSQPSPGCSPSPSTAPITSSIPRRVLAAFAKNVSDADLVSRAGRGPSQPAKGDLQRSGKGTSVRKGEASSPVVFQKVRQSSTETKTDRKDDGRGSIA